MMRALLRHKSALATRGSTIITRPKPSIKSSVTLLATTLTGVGCYTTYQVGYQHSPVFIPYWLCSKHRKPLKSDMDRGIFVQKVESRLQDRLQVDEEVHKLLGTPVRIVDFDSNSWNVTIKMSEPGVKGLNISPDPLHFSVEARPFSKISSDTDSYHQGSASGIDRVLLPFLPGQADSEDAMLSKPNDRPPHLNRTEAMVSGSVTIAGKNLKDVQVSFTAVQSLDHPKSAPKFTSAVLKYTDHETGINYKRRLW